MYSSLMANDSPDPRRKHPHSPSADESQDRSKRHKHRHHHRSHHRRHRHRSRSMDHDDDRIGGIEAGNGGENVGIVEQIKRIAISDMAKADSDMEEGEIIDDEDFSGGGAEFGAMKAMLDSESAGIGAVDASSGSNMRVMDHEGTSEFNDDKSLVINNGKSIRELKSPGNDRTNSNLLSLNFLTDVKNPDCSIDSNKLPLTENNANGEADNETNKADKGEATLHRGSCSPANGKNKHKGLSGAEVARLDTSSRLSQHLRQGHGLCDDYDKGDYVLMKDRNNERRHAKEERNQDHVLWDRERKEKCRARKKEKETKIRDKDHQEERQHHGRDKGQESSRIRETKKEREDGGKGEKLRDRSRYVDGECNEVRYREKDYRISKASDLPQRGSSPASYRDMDMEREWEKDRERYRDRSRDVHERQRDNGSDRHKGKDRDVMSNNGSRHYGHDGEDKYGAHGRSYVSIHVTNDSKDFYRNSRKTHDSIKDRSSRDDLFKESKDKVNRDVDYQNDYPENMELELVEQEEEDINRIKEESRKRREAILKKYRTKEMHKKVEAQPNTAGKVLDECEPSGTSFAARVLQGRSDDKVDQAFSVGKSPSQNEASTLEKSSGVRALGEGTPKSDRSTDMFCDDIFGGPVDEVCKMGKGDGLHVERSALHDDWDDPEGHYGYRLGEMLDGRYEIIAAHGQGVFSKVVRAKDLKAGKGDPEEVAIKIIRNNDIMLKAGMEELVILKKLVGADPDDRRHCVRYISSFKYRNHLCLVFKSLHMNLREVLKKFGRNIGLKLTAVRAYSKQLFIALKHLKNCGVLHCDIKLDNMLVNDAKNVLKLCDFGSAMFAGKNEVTPYLVSRFYRAPEIMLGLAYDHPLDMWSVGCCMYELYTGKVLFPGATNNDMLRLHMELKGSFPKKMLRKGAFTDQNFDQDSNFLAIEEDVVTKKTVRRLIVNIKPKDIGAIIKGSPGEDPKMLADFKDLLDKIFVLDPDKRLTVSQALGHPFITGK